MLPFTFANPADYERFGQDDRVSIVGLQGLAPGRPVTARIKRPDGTVQEVELRHSLTQEHIAWFRAGAALKVGAA